MVFHMLINGQDARRKHIRSGDRVDDQSLGRSCVRFPRSHAVKSCACSRACRSHDESCARSRDESRARSHDESHARSHGGD